jgi:hypothetical protein
MSSYHLEEEANLVTDVEENQSASQPHTTPLLFFLLPLLSHQAANSPKMHDKKY